MGGRKASLTNACPCPPSTFRCCFQKFEMSELREEQSEEAMQILQKVPDHICNDMP